MKERADIQLTKLGLASSRSKATDLIKEGVVYSNGVQLKKPSEKITDENIEVRKEIIYVSRGAYKLEGAAKEFNIDFKGKTVADVGASTGGFTDFALRSGAEKVFTIDVGHDQLDPKILNDERVENFEGVNIRDGIELSSLVDIAISDLSYISLRLVLKKIFELVKVGGEIVVLYKPQFEVGKDNIGKNGLVKSDIIRITELEAFKAWCIENSMPPLNTMESPIKGKRGNIEYLFHFIKGKH